MPARGFADGHEYYFLQEIKAGRGPIRMVTKEAFADPRLDVLRIRTDSAPAPRARWRGENVRFMRFYVSFP